MIFQNYIASSALNDLKYSNLSSEGLKLSMEVNNFNLTHLINRRFQNERFNIHLLFTLNIRHNTSYLPHKMSSMSLR